MAVVVCGLAAYVPGIPGASLSMLRTFRVLRPLRSLRVTPTLRQIVEALLGSIPGIINVLILQTMFFVLFAVLGLQVRFRMECGDFYCQQKLLRTYAAFAWVLLFYAVHLQHIALVTHVLFFFHDFAYVGPLHTSYNANLCATWCRCV